MSLHSMTEVLLLDFDSRFEHSTRFFRLIFFSEANENAPVLFQFSGHFPPHPFITTSPNIFITWQTDLTTQFGGFNLEFSHQDLCPNLCSDSGFCRRGECLCFGGLDGAECSEFLDIPTIEPNVTVSETIADRFFSYYQFDLEQEVTGFDIEFAVTGNGGNPEFFVQQFAPPNLMQFDRFSQFFAVPY